MTIVTLSNQNNLVANEVITTKLDLTPAHQYYFFTMSQRKLEFLFQEPGLIEAIAFGSDERREELVTEGYRDCGIPDLMIDLHPDLHQPYGFMSLNFDKTYPAVIWGLRLLMNDERFDVPQANLTQVTLAEAFSWAYTHFILEDEQPQLVSPNEPVSLTRRVLQHALADVQVEFFCVSYSSNEKILGILPDGQNAAG